MAKRTSYLNATELEGGRILLFNRPNAKKNVWHMRIYVAGMEDISGDKVKYYTRSTGELDLDRAKRIALDTYESLRDKVRNEEPVFDSTFRQAYQKWWNTQKKPNLEERQRRRNSTIPNPKPNDKVSWYGKHFERYWSAYFGDMELTKITNSVSSEYWRWRLHYWDNASEEERKAYPNHAKVPSPKTMRMERGALREFFGWCVDNKLCRIVPNFWHAIFENDNQTDTRRASFDKDEWVRLDRYMRERWVVGRGVGDKPEQGKPHSGHLRQRQMTRRYIQWITATGMRPAEPLYLQHKHIEKIKLDDGTEVLEIYLPQGKTGARKIYSQPVCVKYYDAIREITQKTDPEDFVFCDKEGKPSKGYYRTLNSLLISLGMRYHPKTGGARTAYSFRHFYAEQRVSEAGRNLATTADLRSNMGTGIQQLENHYLRKQVYDPEGLISYKEKREK